ncbi:MAG: BREX system ATP-binding domain-containing protein [Prochlorotrichaceae cyanobacterium]
MNRNTAIAVIESLRSGIPTRTSTRELPDARPGLTSKIAQDLDDFISGNYPKGRFIWGAYGQGKTHELTCIEHLALDRGFAVSRVTLSRELSGQHLFRLYGKLASSIKTPDSKHFGIQHKLDKKTSGDLPDSLIQEKDRYTHPLPAIVLEDYFYATDQQARELLYRDILGEKPPIGDIKKIHRESRAVPFPKIPPFGVLKHGQAYFEVMSDVIQWCGYKGWIILIDEIELIARLGKVGRLNAYKNLSWLLNWSVQPQNKGFPFYFVGGVASPLMNLWLGSEKTAPDKEIMPQLAMTKFDNEEAAEIISFFFEEALNNQQCPSINPLNIDQIIQILAKLVEFHQKSYNWNSSIIDRDLRDLINSLGSSSLRTYIRALLESLDIKFLYSVDFKPNINIEDFDILMTEDTGFFQE